MNETMPTVKNLDDAALWIGALHRRTVRDAERMNVIEARLSLLQTPKWRWRKRKRLREWLAFLKRQAALR